MKITKSTLIFILFAAFAALASCASDPDESADGPALLPIRQGVYTGVASGYLGDVHIEVEVDAVGRIFRIDVTAHEETPGFAYPTFEIMRAAIIENQSTNIDLITGATATSRAFRDGVEDALLQAGVTLAQLRPGATPPPADIFVAETPPEITTETPPPAAIIDTTLSEAALAALPVATANFTPGEFIAVAAGWQEAPMTVQVTFDENRITDIEILEHDESMYGSGWAFRALPAVPDQILVRQSTQDIDAFTGATITRNAVIYAVENAITQAGAEPSQLTPQFIDAPLPGDRFIPGFIEINVPAGTMDIYGNPLAGDAMRMLYSEDDDMNLRLSFGRNEFHLHSGGAFGLGQGAEGHGESIYEPGVIGGGALGGWWFRQVVNHQINDTQSTQNIDIHTGATMSAAAIIWGVEQAMSAQGANPADITPLSHNIFQRAPGADAADPFFIPGIYTVTVDGWGGPMVVRVTLDRTNIRRIEVIEHNETESFWDMVWGAPADHVMRDAIFAAGPANLDDVDLVSGATVSAEAILNAVRTATEQAWVN
ncbi:MAG: FMN-binding protein [Defluviitaleaceae bacterium]|nr:FMN-binding protein [Defluviitaleaceae bacterium]